MRPPAAAMIWASDARPATGKYPGFSTAPETKREDDKINCKFGDKTLSSSVAGIRSLFCLANNGSSTPSTSIPEACRPINCAFASEPEPEPEPEPVSSVSRRKSFVKTVKREPGCAFFVKPSERKSLKDNASRSQKPASSSKYS